MNDIYHTCHCLGRKFTFDQWIEYAQAHPHSGNEPIFEEFGFKWNIHDICINPHTINILPRKASGFERLAIDTAQTSKGWVYGILYSGLDDDEGAGGGFGAGYARPTIGYFATENAAIIAALERCKRKKLRKEYASLIDLEIAMRQNPQLTLF